MPSYKVRAFLGFVLVLCTLTMACGGGKPVSYKNLVFPKANPPSAYVGVPYGYTFAATGGLTPYTWSISAGSLPAGLSLNASTGALSGTPTTAASYTFTVQCTDSQSPTNAVATENLTMKVTAVTKLSVTSFSLANAYLANPYNASLTAKGGVPPYTWTIDSGSLPAGLSLSSSGAITGTPTAVGMSTFTVKAADSETSPQTATAMLSVTVQTVQPLTITTTSLMNAVIGASYNAPLSASGGIPPYAWSVASGTLPLGLSLNPTGVISGTPTALGTSTFTLKVTDSELMPATQTVALSITVNNPAPLVITTTSLPNGSINVAYFQSLVATGGTPPYTWSLISGALPPGLSLDATSGTITGTPTQLGTSSFTVQVQDSAKAQQTASASLTLTISTVGDNLLNGNYAFSLNGFSNGSPIFMAGSLVSNGSGKITSGVFDITSSTGTAMDTLATTSQYNIGDNGVGTVTLDTVNHGTFTLNVSAPLSGGGIRFILENSKGNQTGTYGSGGFYKQNTTSFNVSNLAGLYIFGLSGVDSAGARFGRIGVQTIGAGGAISAGDSDVNDAGVLSDVTTASGTYGAIDATTGRGTAVFNDSNANTNYVVYMVSSNEVILLEAEPTLPATMTVGLVAKQALSNSGGSSLSGNTVLELTGVSGTAADVAIARPVFTTANSTNTFTATTDENDGGSITQTGYSGSFAIDATTGHVTFSGTAPLPVTMYMVTPDTAFVLGTESTVKFGTLEQQNVPAFGKDTITGSYLGASTLPALAAVTNEADLFTSDGNLNITAGSTYTSGPSGDTSNTALTGTYTAPDLNGRTVISLTGGETYIGYVLSSNEFALISGAATDTQPKVIVMQK